MLCACHTDCLREVHCTLALQKPLCLMFDPVRGGAPLPDLEAECDAKLQPAIFGPPDNKRDVIPWHRIKDVRLCHLPARPSLSPSPSPPTLSINPLQPLPHLAQLHPQFQLVALKLIAEQMLLGRPLEVLRSINLFIPGELQRQRLVLSRRPVVYASPNNPGALAVAKDIASAMNGHIEVTSDAAELLVKGPRVTHFLLYLNDKTYLHAAGRRLADELRKARAVGSTIEVVMVHENDQERGGCEFGILFDGRTPQDLLHGGIYNVRACMLSSPATNYSMCLKPALIRTGTRAGAILWSVLAGLGRAGGQGDWRDHRRLVLTR